MERKQTGLNNGGNNCFFNSVLQLLYDCTVLNKYITSNNIEGTILNIYKDFLNNYNNGSHSINPSKITRHISSDLGRNRNTQEDSDVYLTYIFDCLISEINDDINKKKIANLTITSANIKLCDFINSLGTIKMKKHITCSVCSNVSSSDENINKLYLSIDKDKNFSQMIKSYCRDELNGENKYKCDKCNKKVDAIIDRTYESMPKYLFVTLKRYNNRNQKIADAVDIPYMFNIGDKYEYHLRGIIYHMGSTGGGHYVYYGRRNNSFTQYNDSTVSDVSEKEFEDVKKHGYIYLYAATKIYK